MTQKTAKLSGVIALFAAAFFALAPAAQAEPIEGGPSGSEQLTKPVLEVTKSVDVSTVNPGGVVTYTITVKNTGAGAATGLKVADILPVGLALTTTGKNTFDYTFLGQLDPGKTITTSYSAKVTNDITANGEYVNVATISAANHDPVTVRASVNVVIPVVKGATTTEKPATQKTSEPEGQVLGAADELPATGIGQLDIFLALLGAGLIGAGLIGIKRTRRA